MHVIPYLLSSLHGPLHTSAGGYVAPDVCVCAPTGCGKTLCYVLPIVAALISRVVQQVSQSAKCVVVCWLTSSAGMFALHFPFDGIYISRRISVDILTLSTCFSLE